MCFRKVAPNFLSNICCKIQTLSLLGLLSGPHQNVMDLSMLWQTQDVLDILSNVLGKERSTGGPAQHGLCLLGCVLEHEWDELTLHHAGAHAGHSDVLALWDVSNLERFNGLSSLF